MINFLRARESWKSFWNFLRARDEPTSQRIDNLEEHVDKELLEHVERRSRPTPRFRAPVVRLLVERVEELPHLRLGRVQLVPWNFKEKKWSQKVSVAHSSNQEIGRSPRFGCELTFCTGDAWDKVGFLWRRAARAGGGSWADLRTPRSA